MTIAINAVYNIIYNETTFEQIGTLFIILTLFLGEYIVYLDQGRFNIDSPAKFNLFGDIFL